MSKFSTWKQVRPRTPEFTRKSKKWRFPEIVEPPNHPCDFRMFHSERINIWVYPHDDGTCQDPVVAAFGSRSVVKAGPVPVTQGPRESHMAGGSGSMTWGGYHVGNPISIQMFNPTCVFFHKRYVVHIGPHVRSSKFPYAWLAIPLWGEEASIDLDSQQWWNLKWNQS